MSRSAWITLACLAAIAVSLGVFVFRPLPTSITRENIDRIDKPGMEMSEVIALLGPPRDETDGLGRPQYDHVPSIILQPDEEWIGESVRIGVFRGPGANQVYGITINDVQIEATTIEYCWWRVRRAFGGGVRMK